MEMFMTQRCFKCDQYSSQTVCQGKLCCGMDVEGSASGDLFAFAAFDGLHTKGETYHLQSCAFIKCAGNTIKSCGEPAKTSATGVGKLSMIGNFSSSYQFPEVLTLGQKPELVPVLWLYQGSIIVDVGLNGNALTVAIQAIDYDKEVP